MILIIIIIVAIVVVVARAGAAACERKGAGAAGPPHETPLSRVLCQRSAEVPVWRSALSVCPCGDPWGTPLQVEMIYSLAPAKLARGQTLRSPRPTVTSVLTRL